MGKNGHSEPNLFGGYTHYDKNGHKIGRSEPNMWGGYTDYDAKGHKIGHTDPGIFGDYKHYDNKGHKIGTSSPGIFGDITHYDAERHKIGTSSPNMTGGYKHSDTGGCYIATCVYGSYDCPPVWTLRRFRDGKLAASFAGRAFIRLYYAISPTLVRIFGNTRWFKKLWRGPLDRMVKKLKAAGYSDKPYEDAT